MQKFLVVTGVVLIAAGIAWPWLGRLTLGRLPGDIIISRPNLKVYFPITTMVVVSIVLSIIMWVIRK